MLHILLLIKKKKNKNYFIKQIKKFTKIIYKKSKRKFSKFPTLFK